MRTIRALLFKNVRTFAYAFAALSMVAGIACAGRVDTPAAAPTLRPLKAVPTPIAEVLDLAPTPDWSIPYVPPKTVQQPTLAQRNPAAAAAPPLQQRQPASPCQAPVRNAPAPAKTETKSSSVGNVTLTIEVERKTFLVQGCSDRQLRDSALRNIPLKVSGGNDGVTQAKTLINYTFNQKASSCAVGTATLHLSIVVFVPEADSHVGIAAEELSKWDTYVAAIRTHEDHHVGLHVQGAVRLQNALALLSASPKCADVEKSIRATKDRIADEVLNQNRAFDVAEKRIVR